MQDKPAILFRADGNTTIGLGHIYRCLAIAERLGNDFVSFFAIRQPAIELKNVIGKFANLIELDEYNSYEDEAKDIAFNVVSRYKIDVITLDGYCFATEYQKIIKQNCKSVVISIDDDQPFHYVSDVVINHAGALNPLEISKELYTKLYLGYDYLLLRKQFIRLLNTEKKIEGIQSVLICFGGADPENYTIRVLDCLKEQQDIKKITVVIGASYVQIENLKESARHYQHVEIKSNLDAGTLAELMGKTDLAVVPSSTIGLEAFAAKMILITGKTADNQANIYNGLINESTVTGIGNFNSLSCEVFLVNLNTAIRNYRNYTFVTKNTVQDNILELYQSLV